VQGCQGCVIYQIDRSKVVVVVLVVVMVKLLMFV